MISRSFIVTVLVAVVFVSHANADPPSDWWSLRPLQKPPVPQARDDAGWAKNPIDAFILAKLQEKGLSPSPQADRRTLIRRLYFDLIGLPPTPEEIEAFIADRNPLTYEKLVDRLLASPRYGERWARHWLDVVHFGETHGYDKDKPREHAWPYRDYVTRAFNEDKPYARFVQEQVAGDVLFPFTRDGIEALGFISAGPWDFIGHAEVPETKIDGKIARHLDRDDMVTNTIQTFNSLTIQCAQCHDHKFDPISQEDYYSLQAVFAAMDRTDREYDLDPNVAKKRIELHARNISLFFTLEELQNRLAKRAGPRFAEIEDRIEALTKATAGADRRAAAFGYHSQIAAKPDVTKWVQVDLQKPVALRSIVLHPCKDDFNNIGEGFGFPIRYRVEISNDADFRKVVFLVTDHTGDDNPNPRLQAQEFAVRGKEARYIRVTATKLAPRMNDFIFALSELEAIDGTGKNVALSMSVTALDSIDAPPRWRTANLTDGYYPGLANAVNEIAQLQKERGKLLARVTQPEDRELQNKLDHEKAALDRGFAALPEQRIVYVGAVHTGSDSNAFHGTGRNGGKPRPIFILPRGNVQKPGQEVGPGALHAVTALPCRFELPPNHTEGDRRAALGRWLTDRRNPLTWRSMVNRVWQYHFGKGIVDTPNDFGKNGGTPTHPELLDWLAADFRDNGGSIKRLHRMIVCSATYQQSSFPSPQASEASLRGDSENNYLSHMSRRRLEAEAIRDAVLAVSGKLTGLMYGPSFRDFVIDKPEHSPHYEYHLHDPEDPSSHRRSIYRFAVRSQPQPFMTTLDCADPSMQVARRNESLSALQALALLNNDLMIVMARHYAKRLEKWDGDLSAQVERAFYECLGRRPSAAERQALVQYTERNGLANLCRLLFNLNEFVFVD
jgi:hypothetical protein